MRLFSKSFIVRLIRLRNQLGVFWPLIISQATLLGVVALAVYGYMELEGWSMSDALYMVVITLSTVGFGEVQPLSSEGRMLTTFLILAGVGNFAFILGAFSQLLVEGRFFHFIGSRRVLKTIGKLKDHCVVCGYGRIGSVVVNEIIAEAQDVVVIENDPEAVKALQEEGILYVDGDATSDEVLAQAGVANAKNLITALSEDAANVYVVLSAREMNKDIYIVSRASTHQRVSKIKQAGADSVILPNHIGGLRLAQSVLRPTVTSFMELAYGRSTMDIQMEELTIGPDSQLVGKDLIESELRPKFNLIVIAIKKNGKDMIFNPEGRTVLEAGNTIIAVGANEKLKEFARLL
ncbi:potassium channel family protein [Halodesulfovibrio spirochaetisodalis]|uniref:Potassium transporter TrkA n=1 Tax=Halodesulfovibrio spirochaetisodalis TaxID=1560234 RepID=A0A1B7X9R5_9BACT|nr:potassium channel protein [Halodesulfovibrio spirochaetisodalis]OBQ46040.1 potassium transporter TrkA [Halodesulfovibrio spirochaetisodalis]